MSLETTFLNGRIPLFEGMYGHERALELDTASRVYNRRLGPVTWLRIARPDTLDISIYTAYGHHSPIHRLVPDVMVKAGPQVGVIPGGGKGITPLHAIMGALGEMTER